MESKKELSDNIGKLFCLKTGQFNPEVHRSITESIVETLGQSRTYFACIADLIRINVGPIKLDHIVDLTEKRYNVRHIGRDYVELHI